MLMSCHQVNKVRSDTAAMPVKNIQIRTVPQIGADTEAGETGSALKSLIFSISV